MNALPIGWLQLAIAAMLVVCAMALLRAWRIGMAGALGWGAVRTVVQLLAVGYVLRWIFAADQFLVVLAAFAVMLSAAAWTASRRPATAIPGLLPIGGFALAVGAGATTLAVTGLVVRAQPWWAPRYFLPLAGMIIGNAMNAAALTAERLQAELAGRAGEVEELLAMGASPRQAADASLRAAIRAGLVPTVNAMMTVGLVSLPGMMTGQILAGADPTTAARYQIVVMFMLTSATTIASMILAALVHRRFFTRHWQLRSELLRLD